MGLSASSHVLVASKVTKEVGRCCFYTLMQIAPSWPNWTWIFNKVLHFTIRPVWLELSIVVSDASSLMTASSTRSSNSAIGRWGWREGPTMGMGQLQRHPNTALQFLLWTLGYHGTKLFVREKHNMATCTHYSSNFPRSKLRVHGRRQRHRLETLRFETQIDFLNPANAQGNDFPVSN